MSPRRTITHAGVDMRRSTATPNHPRWHSIGNGHANTRPIQVTINHHIYQHQSSKQDWHPLAVHWHALTQVTTIEGQSENNRPTNLRTSVLRGQTEVSQRRTILTIHVQRDATPASIHPGNPRPICQSNINPKTIQQTNTNPTPILNRSTNPLSSQLHST